jgi:hypothetical protein
MSAAGSWRLAGLFALAAACAPERIMDVPTMPPLPAGPDPACTADMSYQGCRYWAVDLDNAVAVVGVPDAGDCSSYGPGIAVLPGQAVCVPDDGGVPVGACQFGGDCSDLEAGYSCQTLNVCGISPQRSPFAVVVSNPDRMKTAKVTLTNFAGTTYEVDVPPSDVRELYPQMEGFADQSLDHSGISPKAYLITSDHPVVVYQFNPLENVGVFSNDGSLLLPEHTLGTRYSGASLPTVRVGNSVWNSTLTVVATGPGDTTVKITPNDKIRAGHGVAELAAKETATFTLHRFEVLNLEGHLGADLSGTRVESDQPVSVFGGHEAAILNNGFPFATGCCADHLEEQLIPTTAWGTHYAVANSRGGSNIINDVVRVVASADGTVVSFKPSNHTCFIDAGQWCDEPFNDPGLEVLSNQPVQVAHYLTGTGGISPTSGDPSMSMAASVDRFLTRYVFLAPENFAETAVLVVTKTGGQTVVDGENVTVAQASFATGAYSMLRKTLTTGRHTVDCPLGCSVEVVGLGQAVSYLYSGGMSLDIAPPMQ